MAMTPKHDFDFDRGSLNEEKRKARALEYIAHYLDRIEGQLDRIAGTLEKGTTNSTEAAASLKRIAASHPGK